MVVSRELQNSNRELLARIMRVRVSRPRCTADRRPCRHPDGSPRWVAREESLTRFASRAADIRLRETSIPWRPTHAARSTSRGTSFASRDIEIRELRSRFGGVAQRAEINVTLIDHRSRGSGARLTAADR